MYTGVVELHKTKIALSSSLTNRGSSPEWCKRLMAKLRMGGGGGGVGGFSWGLQNAQNYWAAGKVLRKQIVRLHESVTYNMSLFFHSEL